MFYWLIRAMAAPLLRAFFRPWIRGADKMPSTGPVILASNHLAVIDSFVLPIRLPRKVRFIAKDEYFNGRGLTGKLKAGFFRAVGAIPVDRSGGKQSEAALRTSLQILQEGGVFGIYPEGTRSPDGRLYRGKTGVARLALDSGALVVPVAMIGTDKAQPLGRVIPKPVRVGMVIGEPMDFSRYQGMGHDRFILRSVTDEIMYALMSLSGQEYVDMYAATAKARIAAGHKADEVPSAEHGHGAPGGRTAPDVQVPVPPEVPGPAA